MPTKTTIEWTDFTSNWLRYRDATGANVWACAKVSPGCKNCYSEAIAERFGRGGPFNLQVTQGLTPYLDADEMAAVLRSRAISGKRLFPFDMTDLFGEWVTDEMIAASFGLMAARPDVTFQILTKRAERLPRWFEWIQSEWNRERRAPSYSPHSTQSDIALAAAIGAGVPRVGRNLPSILRTPPWPLPNVHIGVSVEDQERADERILHLLRVPAAVRFLSVEPMLGPVALHQGILGCVGHLAESFGNALIHWVIVGGESGPGARPLDFAWVRSIADQCAAAGTAYFFKQAGARPTASPATMMSHIRGAAASEAVGYFPGAARIALTPNPLALSDRKGGDVDELARLIPGYAAAGVFRREWPAVRP